MTDMDRGKDYEPDIYATHEEDYDDFDVEEEEEGGSRAAIVLLVVIGVVLLLGVAYVSYRMGYENGQREASVPRLQATAEGGKVQPDEPGGLAQPQESALDESVSGEGGDEFAQLLPREEEVIDVTSEGESSEAVPGIDVPIEIEGAEPGTEASESVPEPAAQPAEDPEPARSEPEPQPDTPSSSSSRIMVPKPGGAAPSSGAGTAGTSSSGTSTSGSASVPAPPPSSEPSPSANTVPAPGSSTPSGSAPAPSMSGNYVVQLASLPSQDAADAAWRNTSAKYPDLLEGAIRDIQEADLGERGIFYRLRVGYFESLSEAKQLCETLKSRGQDCLVKSR